MSLNYITWKNENRAVLETFPGKKIYMLYTGGKDSSVILWFLISAGKEFGFDFETSAAVFPRQVFPESDIQRLDGYWRAKNVNIQWHNLDRPDSLLSEAQAEGRNPCYVCHMIKRAFLFQYLGKADQIHKDIVIILSFSLWDIVSYTIEYLVGGVYGSGNGRTSHKEKSAEQRFFETSQRFYPYIALSDGLSIFKPLLKYNDQEIMKIVQEEGIPLASAECQYKHYTPKRILSNYYNQVDAVFNYDNVISFVKDSLKMNDLSYYEHMGKEDFIKVL
ncbi:MAG: hypothetical protein JW884_09680 [Deltaproteobacteria bacterium]|nr:hypothetical protein [Deltaproteobacteria bacterium]